MTLEIFHGSLGRIVEGFDNSHSQTQMWQPKGLELQVYFPAGPPEVTFSVARI